MLLELHIAHIVLIAEAHLNFSQGLTILSGETGAGKSAILKALGLLLGDRADPKLVRKGAERGSVEGVFAISSSIADQLDEAGIPHEVGEPMILRREITADRSRAFVNGCAVQRAFLQKLSLHLVDLVGQHANQRLANLDYHREVVDLYGHVDRDPFVASWCHLQEVRRRKANEAELVRTLATCERELEELKLLDSGIDEEQLNSDHTRLVHVESLLAASEEADSALDQILPRLRRLRLDVDKDRALEPIAAGIETATFELEEAQRLLSSYVTTLDLDPSRLHEIEAQISAFEKLRKAFGPEPHLYRERRQAEYVHLQEMQLEEVDIARTEAECDRQAKELTEQRRKAAKALEKELGIEIRFTPAPRSEWGDETLEFFFAPNRGEGMVSVRTCGSGGELSRLLLALKTVLAGLERTPTLIFDEIDANIGGATATRMGENLHSIAQGRQVLCITHLPQVARQGDAHFCIAKREEGGRTITRVELVQGETRNRELQRMLG